jgi:beta-N-acetylhexosaminidase
MKHMPGHGRTVVDSHHDLPAANAPAEELERTDFAPFRALNDLPMGMTGHIVVPAFDGESPSTQSAAMVGVIRDRIGFQGLLLTDDLTMQALSGTLADRTARSIRAGCDVALHCNGSKVRNGRGRRSRRAPDAIRRCPVRDQALSRRQVSCAIDADALMAELKAILSPARA